MNGPQATKKLLCGRAASQGEFAHSLDELKSLGEVSQLIKSSLELERCSSNITSLDETAPR
jgi:hypothetical protein